MPYNWLLTFVYYTGSQDGFLQPFAAHTAWVLCPSRIPKNSRRLECTDSAQTRTQLEAWRSPNHTQEDTSHIDYYCRFLRFRVHTLTSKLKLCYVCSKGNRSHKNQKSYCSTCNSHDRISSREMEVCKALQSSAFLISISWGSMSLSHATQKSRWESTKGCEIMWQHMSNERLCTKNSHSFWTTCIKSKGTPQAVEGVFINNI